jgi:hypothetical protein
VRSAPLRNRVLGLALLGVALWTATSTAETLPSKTLPGVSIDDRGRSSERSRLEAALGRLQRSATVRRMEARRRKQGAIVVAFAKLDTSTKSFSGSHGHTDVDHEPARVEINEALIGSHRAFFETLAHELYGHGVLLREAARLGLDLGHTIDNEAFSLAVGAAAALEIGEPIEDEARLDALAVSPSAYAAEVLFTDSPARIEFTLEEARDPRAAIAARQKELARRRLSVSGRRREALVWRWKIEHFEKVHRAAPETFGDLRASLDELTRETLPGRSALLDAAEPHLKEVAAFLNGKDGRAFIAGMVATAASPYMKTLDADLAALGRRIAELRARRPKTTPAPVVPAASIAPTVKQTDWNGLSVLEARDRRENPGHWTGAPEVQAPAPAWR